MERRVLLIVPTLGQRPEFLTQTLESIAAQSVPADVVVVTPDAKAGSLARRFGAAVLADPGGLPAAINLGVGAAGPQHAYVNWLGDDDLLEPESLARTVGALDADERAVLAYGSCRYIDADGRQIWLSSAGRLAPWILSWGPDLIPQPGMLVRRSAWDAVGGLDTSFRFAFDLDLLLKLRRVGGFVDVGAPVSSFRWHGDSMTVSDRETSLRESERARRRALNPVARRLAWTWEAPVRVATRAAAGQLHRRVAKQ
jgi:GT2 family glycosyltransferase